MKLNYTITSVIFLKLQGKHIADSQITTPFYPRIDKQKYNFNDENIL